jgi:serine/threonine protein kinase
MEKDMSIAAAPIGLAKVPIPLMPTKLRRVNSCPNLPSAIEMIHQAEKLSRAKPSRAPRQDSKKKSDLSERFFKSYSLGKKLGQGSAGEVYVVCDQDYSEVFAAKINYPGLYSSLLTEEAHLKRLQKKYQDWGVFPRVECAFDAAHKTQRMIVMTKYDQTHSLGHSFTRQPLNFRELVHFTYAIAVPYIILHREQIIHSDVKPGNTFFNRYTGEVSVIDFSHAEDAALAMRDRHLIGTQNYRPPEIEANVTRTTAIDAWSLGCMLYEVASGGKLPFPTLGLKPDSNEKRYLHIVNIVNKMGLRLPGHFKGGMITDDLLDKATFLPSDPQPLYRRLCDIMAKLYASAPPKQRDDFCKFVTLQLIRYENRMPAHLWTSCDFLKDELHVRLFRKPDCKVKRIAFTIFRASEGEKAEPALQEVLIAEHPRVCRTFPRDPKDQYILLHNGAKMTLTIPALFPCLIYFDGDGCSETGLFRPEDEQSKEPKDDEKSKGKEHVD